MATTLWLKDVNRFRYGNQQEEGHIMAGKFEVYQDKAGKHRFRLKAGNGEVVATGEAYETKAAAIKGCESVQSAAADAKVVEVDN